jgi:uncharacterized protein
MAYPWHDGEIALQKRYGSFEQMTDIGPRIIRDAMPDQHRAFFENLPFLLLGTTDAEDRPWASLVTGEPGFVTSPDDRTLAVSEMLADTDPAKRGLRDGAPVGLLGIELSNRRRNRMNGHVLSRSGRGFVVEVEHSFGNCPKYIQLRQWEAVDHGPPNPPATETLHALDDEAKALIANADTFFVASYAETATGRQIDVSHRGGKPGFVKIGEDGSLTIPDFSGNRFFNTLGNIAASGKAGLLFLDFESGDLLHLSGTAEIVHEDEDATGFVGAERLWRLIPEQIARRTSAVQLRWTKMEGWLSPFVQRTGAW